MKRLSLIFIAGILTICLLAQQQEPRPFAVRVEMVSMPVTFIDGNGDFVDNIEHRELTLTDNGKPQKIRSFEVAGQPISMVILADTSSRIKGVLPNLRTSGILFTQLIMGETGEAAVLTYDKTVEIRQNFTTNGDLVEHAIKSLNTEAEDSRLTDGVLRGVGMLSSRPENRRRVLVVLGDGRDLGSESRRTQTLIDAQLANVAIYTVELSAFKSNVKKTGPDYVTNSQLPPGAFPQEPGIPLGFPQSSASSFDILTPIVEGTRAIKGIWSHPMKTYAGGTGSNHINATDKRAIEDAVQKIARELHNQYWLSYHPDNLTETHTGADYHNIRITVSRPGVKVRHRPGYLFIP